MDFLKSTRQTLRNGKKYIDTGAKETCFATT
jgi:hypothetical protein